jgi:hypothetical protein
MMRVWLCLALAACANKPSEPPRVTEPPRRPERHGPVHTTPYELFCDFTRPDADGLALLDKYAGGATFTATIKTVGVEEDGTPVAWIDVDGENMITLDFAAPAPAGLEPGATLTVTCKIGGASGALMMVTRCTAS